MNEPRTIHKQSPVTGEPLGSWPIAGSGEVDAAVARARAAFPAWSALSVGERLRRLGRLRDVLRRDGEAFARRVSDDTGKPLVDSLMTELLSIPFFLDHYDRVAPKVLSRRRVKVPLVLQPRTSYVEHYPMGVVAVISPWNFPVQLAVVPVLSALIAGNTVVLKPSEVTPLTADVIDEMFAAIDLPAGVFELVRGDGSTGAALTHAEVDKIFFTGSVATGRKVMAAAAERPIPVELELGGKDAMIVCADADLERAARGAAWGGLINAGQMCISVERLFVVDAVYDRFVAALRREVERVKVGGPDDDADMGPITFPPQLDTIRRHLADAVERGARIVAGGDVLPQGAQFFAPTIVEDVVPGMALYDEETFGPVLPVVRVRDEDEAVRMANDHIYGLTASVWTRDIKRGTAIASRIEAGQVMINDVVVAVGNPALPFGGVKASGLGRYHGDEGLLTFTHQRAILVNRGLLPSEPFWFPYRGKYGTMRTMFRQLLDGRMAAATTSLVRLLRDGRAARNGEE